MNPLRTLIQIQRQIGNYGLLTLFILLMMLVRPFLNESSGEADLLADVLFTAIFLSVIYAARREHYNFWVAILLATFGFAGRIHVRLSDPETLPIMVNASAMLFFIYTLINVGSHIWSERHRVNHDVIFAAVSAFLLLGIVWTYAYFFLDMANPLSFKGPQAELNRDDFFYFSFVTLATLGYGDIVPVTRPARSLAILEALMGQLYLAILIARLVGAYVAQFGREDR
jgi:hypothetical protein